jgi:UDP-N-acetylmuramate--alanine ligase
MNLNAVHSVYLLGIGGIGMSALARFFDKQGAVVSGYDKTPSPLTEELEEEGISVHFDEDTSVVPRADLYIYTPAIPQEHPAFDFVRAEGGTWYKRSEVLEWITAQHHTVAIAGTHGKTTTTALTAHLLHRVHGNISAFVGGVMTDYQSNLIAAKEPDWIVVEADEYDRSFLRLQPDVVVITSLDPDHLDIYGTFEAMKTDYRSLASKAKLLIVHEKVAAEFKHANMKTYGPSESASFRYRNVRVEDGRFRFEWQDEGVFALGLAGRHNIENACAALSVAAEIGLDIPNAKKALGEFGGVKRRFERVFSSDKKVLIDDYAHHPEEIKAAIFAARELFPSRRIAVVFQPHLFTRTRDLETGFAMELSRADEVLLLPIYPARELPIDGVSSANLLKKLTLKTKHLVQKSELINAVLSLSAEVVLILGAGDIDRFVNPIAEALKLNTNVD